MRSEEPIGDDQLHHVDQLVGFRHTRVPEILAVAQHVGTCETGTGADL